MQVSLVSNHLINTNVSSNNTNNVFVDKSMHLNKSNITPLKNDCINFSGKTKKTEKNQTDTIEEHLKELYNVHDPYSDVIMIHKSKFSNLQKNLKNMDSAEEMIGLLYPCKKHMFPDGEAKTFDILVSENERLSNTKKYRNKKVTFSDILQENFEASKQNLIKQEKQILEDIRTYSTDNLDKNEQFFVNTKLDTIRKSIDDDSFRIKPASNLLKTLYEEIPDKEKVDKIISISDTFPNCATSADAFIVKNAHKSSVQIAEALVSPAVTSVEHIKPQSLGGESKGANYIAASRRMNNLRGSMSYADFIKKYPKIPEQTQKYFDDISQKANQGEIPDIAANIYGAKETLFKESGGLIDVQLNLNKSITDRMHELKGKIDELLAHFKKNSKTS